MPTWLRVGVSVVVMVGVVWFVLIPQYASAVDALDSLERVSFPLVLTAVVLEVGSLLANTALTCSALGPRRPRFGVLLRIDLTNLGVSHVVPGGGLAAATVRFRLLVRAGIRPGDALTAAAVGATVSNLVLGAVFALGLLLSLTSVTAGGWNTVAAGAVLALLLLATAAVWVLTRHTARAVDWARAAVRHVPLISELRAEVFVKTMAEQVRELLTDPRRLTTALGCAALNWLLDAAALWLVLAAFGVHMNVGSLLTVYGLGGIVALLPLTPGGVGIVEGLMVPALVALGADPSAALLGVIGWRLLEFWLPIPVAAVAYGSLRLGALRRPQPFGGETLGTVSAARGRSRPAP